MILKSPHSRLSIVNLFADFILKQIPHEDESIIQVIDCLNFYVIKGKTTYKEPLSLNTIKEEFIEKFQDLIGDIKIVNTIDLIEYDSVLESPKSYTFSYYNNSKNCSYTFEQTELFEQDDSKSYEYNDFVSPINEDENLVFISEFPHGYSLNQGRLSYYYGKHIVYNIPLTYLPNTIIFEISNEDEVSRETPIVVKNIFGDIDETLTSSISDVFDFNMGWLSDEIKKVDWSLEITNPLTEYEFLKKKVKGFVIF
jgi:hypothetical protein